VLSATLAGQAGAQVLRTLPGESHQAVIRPPAQSTASRSVAVPVAGGILAGGAGFIAGAFAGGALVEGGIGSWTGCDNEDLSCLLNGILIGAAIGEATFLPVGAHLGGGRRGNFLQEFLASSVIAAAGLAMTYATAEPAVLIPVPILQILAVTVIEAR
jgi:hypothetical protein